MLFFFIFQKSNYCYQAKKNQKKWYAHIRRTNPNAKHTKEKKKKICVNITSRVTFENIESKCFECGANKQNTKKNFSTTTISVISKAAQIKKLTELSQMAL